MPSAKGDRRSSWVGKVVAVVVVLMVLRSAVQPSTGRSRAVGRSLGTGPARVLCEQVASLDFDAGRTDAVRAFVKSATASAKAGGPRVTPDQLAEIVRRFDGDTGRVAALRDLAPLLSADLRDEDVGPMLKLFDRDAGKNQAVTVLGRHLAARAE